MTSKVTLTSGGFVEAFTISPFMDIFGEVSYAFSQMPEKPVWENTNVLAKETHRNSALVVDDVDKIHDLELHSNTKNLWEGPMQEY